MRMRRAIAGIGIVVLARLFVLLAPVVPTSTPAASPSGSHACAITVPNCLDYTSEVRGYGSISFRLIGVGGTWFDGSYRLVTTSNFSVSVNA